MVVRHESSGMSNDSKVSLLACGRHDLIHIPLVWCVRNEFHILKKEDGIYTNADTPTHTHTEKCLEMMLQVSEIRSRISQKYTEEMLSVIWLHYSKQAVSTHSMCVSF